jgi:hypothetical protein
MKDRRLRMRGRQDIGRGSFVPESMAQQSVIEAGGKHFGVKGDAGRVYFLGVGRRGARWVPF